MKVYAKIASNTWKKEYNKMIKEYLKNKDTTESVKEYFQRKRRQVIDAVIEKKKQEKTKIIERMIYGYDSMEISDEDSEEGSGYRKEPEISSEIVALGTSSISSLWGVKTENPLSATLFHLSTLNSLPPHLELPGPKPEMHVSPIEKLDSDECNTSLEEDYSLVLNSKDKELEDILTSLETSSYGTSISSVDSAAFRKFFKWTVDRLSQIDAEKKEAEERERKKIEEMNMEKTKKDTSLEVYSLKDYYSLDFHEYPKKRSQKDKSKWIQEFSLILFRLRSISNGVIVCTRHANEEEEENRDTKKGQQKKPMCIKCFDANILEKDLSKDLRPSLAEYVFRGMLFLQTVIFQLPLSFPVPKEIDLIKSELHKFYEYYRK